jgi:lysophospholipase L1-like esterase
MTAAPEACDSHLDLVAFKYPLPRLMEALKRQRKIKIVAIGSSSTAGEGDVIPFPHRLELALRSKYPGRMIDVINRGIGGQEAPEELARFESDVLIEQPTLVIWQVGTNAIFHKSLYDLPAVAKTIATGLSWLKGLATDVILMDPQYAPALLQDDRGKPNPPKEKDTRRMVSLISAAARGAEVNLFRRFELMELWVTIDKIDWTTLIGPDGLHQTEFATNCVSNALEAAIETAVGAQVGDDLETGLSAKAGPEVERRVDLALRPRSAK